jgi:DNA-binding NtrC family response regulator
MVTRTRVLVVDDEPSIRNSLVEFLEDCLFDVTAADSAENALELIAQSTFHVALVDIRLPKLDGDSLILKAHELNPRMAFIIHTGSVEYKLPEELRHLGITPDQIFLKPQMDLMVFKDAIEKLTAE